MLVRHQAFSMSSIRAEIVAYQQHVINKILRLNIVTQSEMVVAAYKALKELKNSFCDEYKISLLALAKYAMTLDLLAAMDCSTDEVKRFALGMTLYRSGYLRLMELRDTQGEKLAASLRNKIAAPKVNDYLALQNAALCGDAEKVAVLLSDPTLNVNAKDKHGYTALMYAARYGQVKVLRLLLAVSNIEVNHFNIHGETALIMAKKFGHTAIVHALRAQAATLDVNKDFCAKLDTLPRDIIITVANLLPHQGFFSLSRVNKRLFNICQQHPVYALRSQIKIDYLQSLVDQVHIAINEVRDGRWMDEITYLECAPCKYNYIKLRILIDSCEKPQANRLLKSNKELFEEWDKLFGLDVDCEGYSRNMNEVNWESELNYITLEQEYSASRDSSCSIA